MASRYCQRRCTQHETTTWKHWVNFWLLNNRDFNLLEPPQIFICLWIIHLFRRDYAYNTVRSYIFSLASELKFRRGKNFLGDPNAWFIHSTLKHFLKTRDASTLTFRRPITTDMLPLILKNSDMGIFLSGQWSR